MDMKLTQLFSGETHVETKHSVEDAGRFQSTPAQAEHIGKQIRSLVPGQTISGEVIAKNGSEVQIKLSEDMVLNARVDRNLNLEIGKNMTFEVKNNGSALTLSPLFTNVSTDVNVLKALDMAGLPVNQASVKMTEQLMAAGMSVNRSSLQQVYRELNSFPQAAISDIIQLHKLQMPVNEANVNQMASYRNLTHQLTEGMDSILGALPEVFDSMVEEGDVAGAVRLYREILSLIQEGAEQGTSGLTKDVTAGQGDVGSSVEIPAAPGSVADSAENITGQPGGMEQSSTSALGQGEAQVIGAALRNMLPEGVLETDGENIVQGDRSGHLGIQETILQNVGEDVKMQELSQELTDGAAAADGIPDTLRKAVAEEMLKLLDSGQLPSLEGTDFGRQILQFAQGQTDVGQLFASLNLLTGENGASSKMLHELEKLFSGKKFRELFTGQLKKFWSLSPKEIASPGKVEELYRRLDRQLKALAQSLENVGQTNSNAFKATTSMSQNIDFLQQLNQMYAYVQLPLRLQQREAHGELYVYSNKKKLTSKDGKISALLHLDMENLGPVDVYVALQNSKVSTRFYLRDDDMIDFISGHMGLLTERLQKRGYDCSVAMTVRGEAEEATEGGLEPILRQEKGIALSQYAFDVRT